MPPIAPYLPATRPNLLGPAQAGTVQLQDGVTWRSGGQLEHAGLDELQQLSASVAWPGGPWVLTVALVGAVAADQAGWSVAWGVGALWIAALGRVAVAAVRPRIQVEWLAGAVRRRVTAHDLRALPAVARLRRQLEVPGATGPDLLLWDQLATARSGAPWRVRAVAGWLLLWLTTAPLWLGLWAAAAAAAAWQGTPVAETGLILAMGPPLAVLLWPLSGLIGLLAQAPFAWVIGRPRS